MRVMSNAQHDIVSIDIKASTYTSHVGSITDRAFVKACMQGVDTVIHTATLHKPHVATHSKQDFIDTNITGTLNLLEEAVAQGVKSFIFTSTTSTFGDVLTPAANEPAVWVTEELQPIPKNIYGVTKTAAEDLCRLFYRNHKLSCIILRTSRFFPEEDDRKAVRQLYTGANSKANEYLHRRVDVEDVVAAHLLAVEQAKEIGFGKYIISATTPFTESDLAALAIDAPSVVSRLFPDYPDIYASLNWKMTPSIGRVYVNDKARKALGWQPMYDFRYILDQLKQGRDYRSQLAIAIGEKGYHGQAFKDGPYPVEE